MLENQMLGPTCNSGGAVLCTQLTTHLRGCCRIRLSCRSMPADVRMGLKSHASGSYACLLGPMLKQLLRNLNLENRSGFGALTGLQTGAIPTVADVCLNGCLNGCLPRPLTTRCGKQALIIHSCGKNINCNTQTSTVSCHGKFLAPVASTYIPIFGTGVAIVTQQSSILPCKPVDAYVFCM